MRILSIETSCDETAFAVLNVRGDTNPKFTVEANMIASQIKLHAQYGGVFPMMAKREHAKNSIPLLTQTLKKAGLLKKKKQTLSLRTSTQVLEILAREEGLGEAFITFISSYEKPKVDRLAVTVGPGLEPTLWVGISLAKALSLAWDIPLTPVNHMEGHILSVLTQNKKTFSLNTQMFPALSLLVSGGHTELVLAKAIGKYTILGSTRDDAAGEAFDKVARMLGLPYPGGPEVSRLAHKARTKKYARTCILPRPMLTSKDFDFSFSGLKTAVLYTLRDRKELNQGEKEELCREFENAVVEVLVTKTLKAVEKHTVHSIIVGGGVAANRHLRSELSKQARKQDVSVFFPEKKLATDNALMIAIAGFFQKPKPFTSTMFKANGNLHF